MPRRPCKVNKIQNVVFTREAVSKLLETLALKCKNDSAALMLNIEAQDIRQDQSWWIHGVVEEPEHNVVDEVLKPIVYRPSAAYEEKQAKRAQAAARKLERAEAAARKIRQMEERMRKADYRRRQRIAAVFKGDEDLKQYKKKATDERWYPRLMAKKAKQ